MCESSVKTKLVQVCQPRRPVWPLHMLFILVLLLGNVTPAQQSFQPKSEHISSTISGSYNSETRRIYAGLVGKSQFEHIRENEGPPRQSTSKIRNTTSRFDNLTSNTRIQGPVGSGRFGNDVKVLPNGNIVIADPEFDQGATQDVGAVYLFDGSTKLEISRLTGSTAGDRVGSGGITVLPGGNFVATSSFWRNSSSGASFAGAVTFCDGSTGCAGSVSSTNSIVSTSPDSSTGSGGITILANGNFVVSSYQWDKPGGSVRDVGAVTWCSGSSGCAGVIDQTNSLLGDTIDDLVGSGNPLGTNGIIALPSGDFLVRNPFWDNPAGPISNAGAVTFCDGSTGCSGLVSTANSLTGVNSFDTVGIGDVAVLSNGNYVVSSFRWDNPTGPVADVGAVTFCDGSTGCTGAVTAANSLIGMTSGDFVGIGGITPLTNGKYVVASNFWTNTAGGPSPVAGAVTLCDGTTGCGGTVTTANSLVGDTAFDSIGEAGVSALANGNYVVSSPSWDNPAGSKFDAGAVTWCSGTSGCLGSVTSANSLVGASDNDQVGIAGVSALSGGDFVISSPGWDDTSGPIENVGAASFCSGTAGCTGIINSSNSLIGSTTGDGVGGTGSTALSNGNYVVGSPDWDDSVNSRANSGAATWCSGSTGCTGSPNASNSLIGSSPNDIVGIRIAPLSNGNYVVGSQNFDNGIGGVSDVGSVKWCDGSTGCSGALQLSNSLHGESVFDFVGIGGIVPLPNGNYYVSSPFWTNPDGMIGDAGAISFGFGGSGSIGTVSSANSVIGSNSGGNYAVDYDSSANLLYVGHDIANLVTVLDPGTLVTNTNNSGPGSLRQAIIDTPAGGSILFDASVFATPSTISVTGGPLVIDKDLTISGPGARRVELSGAGSGTVIRVDSGNTVLIEGVSISNGSGVNGGIENLGVLTLKRTTITGNSGSQSGGIFNDSSSTLAIEDSTVSGNDSTGNTSAGGIKNDGILTLTNSTISGNSTTGTSDAAGGILNSGSATLRSITVTGNSAVNGGSGIFRTGGTMNIGGSIIAANTNNSTLPDVGATGGTGVDSDGYNLIGNPGSLVFGSSGDQSGTGGAPLDPLISGLSDNGGNTSTHALDTSSPAIDAGNNLNFPAFDQRGVARPFDGDGNQSALPDIGAYEATCAYSVKPVSGIFSSSGGAGSINLTASSGCAWDAVSSDVWITLTGTASGTGDGTVPISVAANVGPARSGTVTIGSAIFTVNQSSGCSYTITPMTVSASSGGDSGNVSVTASNGCGWTASSNDTWITVTGGSPGDGDGNVGFTVAANSGPARSGTITIAGETFTVNQASGCSYSISPTSTGAVAAGSTGNVNVTTAQGCPWNTSPNDAWLSVTSGSSGSGNGIVGYSVAANTGPSRSGSITIAGQTFTVDQDSGCAFSIDPTSANPDAQGGPGTVDVTSTSGCQWTAMSNDAWVTVTGGATGAGNGTVSYSVTANTGAPRSGTISIAGENFTVNQGNGCSYTISPASQTIGEAGATGTVNVITDTGCEWTAISNDAWITVDSGSPGSGNGTVGFTVDINAGTARTGTITIAGETFTVNQDAATATPPPTRFDFTGDGKSDIAVWRRPLGEWWFLQSEDNQDGAFAFGSPTDVPVPADFTGDGIADFSFWRPATGEWFILRSDNTGFYSGQFGANGDIPAPGDFDGDGTDDLAVFRPATGTWFIQRSSDNQTDFVQFGAAADKPMVGDYDNDGKDDVAIYKPDVAQFWQLRSTQGERAFAFGQVGDKAMVADFSGDGTDDMVVWRPATGFWFVLRSEDSDFFGFPFGADGDIPAPADYDGDGTADPTVFRPTDTTWYSQQSTAGNVFTPFGIADDEPVPAAYNAN